MLANVPLKSLVSSQAVSADGSSTPLTGLNETALMAISLAVTGVPAGTTNTLIVQLKASPNQGIRWPIIAAYQFTTAAEEVVLVLGRQADVLRRDDTVDDPSLTILQGDMLSPPALLIVDWGDRLRLDWFFTAGDSAGSYTLAANYLAL